MPEQNITLVNITELPTGTATLANPIMFGIGELLHTTTLEDIKTLMFTGVITEIPPNKIKIVNVFPDANFPENWEIDQLFAVSQAINYTLSTFYGGEITTEPNERIVFRLIQSSYFEPSPGVLIPNVLWRYYSETSGALSFTGISDPSGDIIPNGVIRNEPDDLIDLGDIGVATIESGFNTDPFAPFTMSGNSFVLATQNGEPKIWKWVGGDGLYGGVGTPSVSQDFLLLSQAPTDPLDYLPTKTITATPYTVTFEDLNRPLIFTSNDQVVNIATTLAELATNAGLTLFDFKAHFTGTGTHTINYPDTETQNFLQGALIYALCIDISGDTVWVVKQFEGGGGGVPTLQQVYDESTPLDDEATVDKILAIKDGVVVETNPTKSDSYSFAASNNFRAWQGVGITSDFIYVCSDRNASFALNNSIQKYDHKGVLLLEKTSAYTLTSPAGHFMSFSSQIHIEDGFLFIGVYDINGGGPAPYISRIAKFNATTLDYIEQFEIGNGVVEGIWKYNGEFYTCYFDRMVIRRFNTSWVQQEEYALSPAMKPGGGYQAIFEENGFWYLNWHGSNNYSGTYTPGLDKYSFDGVSFTLVENIDAPTYGSGQGVIPFGGKYYWNDRPANNIIVTSFLGQILTDIRGVNTFETVDATTVNATTVNATTVNATTYSLSQLNVSDKIFAKEIQLLTTLFSFRATGANTIYQIMGAGNDGSVVFQSGAVLKFLFGYDAVPEGFRIYNYAQTSPVFFNPNGNKRIGLNGITAPNAALEIDGGIKIANDTDSASATKVGTIRYRATSNDSYVEMCMQTGAATYGWVIIQQNTW